MTVTTGRANLAVIANLRAMSELTQVHAELADVCPTLRLQETQLSTRAVKIHMRWLTAEDRWCDEVTDPFWALRDQLTAV
jgi:hypothetical protein